jgi:hypothetical protein
MKYSCRWAFSFTHTPQIENRKNLSDFYDFNKFHYKLAA